MPSISIVIPTYNSERTLAQCLKSIATQDYPKEKIEIIIADGGSKDNTVEIAKKYEVNQIIHNTLKDEEFGRAIGVEASRNDMIAFIDQDNVLVSSNWLKKMVKPFKKEEIGGSEPLFYSHRPEDSAVVRYCSLIGGDDPLHIYWGDYDRFCHFKGTWTEAPIEENDDGDYLHVKLLSSREIPTMGANGFMVRRELLMKVHYRPFIHTDIVYQLVKSGHHDFAKVKVDLVHLHAVSVVDFLRKKLRRLRRYSSTKRKRNAGFHNRTQKFILCTVLLLPIGYDAIKGYKRKPDSAWFLHLLICPLILLTYAVGTLGILMKRQIR